MSADLAAVWLTLKLAMIVSVLLIIISLPLAWYLARWQHPAKYFVQSVIALPLVLPPTVLGFYLLILFSPKSGFGNWWQDVTGYQLAFSFTGLVIGSLVYSLPFALQPLYTGFSQLDTRHLEVARVLGLTKTAIVQRIILPLCRPYLIIAFGLSFAHTVGEFGVVLMIGGNIPGETQVLSIALYDHVEMLNYARAHELAFGLLVFSFLLLTGLYWMNYKRGGTWSFR